MTQYDESSYYEIALTNRQVLVGFVTILTCVLIAFLSGVWLGRQGMEPAEQPVQVAETEPADLAELEKLEFFSEESEGKGSSRPDLGEILEKPNPSTTLAQDVGLEKAAPPPPTSPPVSPPISASPAQSTTQPAPSPSTSPPPPSPRAAPPQAPPPAATSSGDGELLVVQVFSTRDAPQADKVLQQLKQAGYPAFSFAVEVDGQKMFRVRIGPYANRAEAEKVGDAVRRKYKHDTWITAASN